MANKFQIKRTTVAGRTANTTNNANSSFIDKGELAVNLADRKVFSSDNSNTLFEVGSNLSSLAVVSIVANGSLGTAGQVLSSNSSGVYWATSEAGTGAEIAYTNAINFAANASNISTGTLSSSRLPATVNVVTAVNVSNTVSITDNEVRITHANNYAEFTGDSIVFENDLDEVGNTFITFVTHDDIVTEKNYAISNVSYSDYAAISRAGLAAVDGINNSNTSIYTRAVTVNTSVISIGNSSVMSTINSTAFVGNGASITSVNAATVGGNTAADLRTYTETYASNATNISSGTINTARLPAANATDAGAVVLVNSVSNTSTTAAAAAAAVKTAYDTAITANTNAAFLAGTAYSNAATYAELAADDAYTSAIAVAANATNLTSGTVNIARIPVLDAVNNTSISFVATANSVKTAYDAATSAYSNAVSYTDTKIGTANTAMVANAAAAYSNAVSYTDTKIGTANTAMTANAAAAYTNSVSYTDTKIGTANTAMVANAGAAYTNAIAIAANATNLTSGTVGETRLPFRMNQNVRTTDTVEFHNVTVTGNINVTGSSIILGGNTTSFVDNMLFLNQGVLANITNIVGNGSVITVTANNNYTAGWDVDISGVNPGSYNGHYLNILTANATHFTVANTNTASYVSGGTARGTTDSNPDLGFAGGYNDGTYHHAGFFRDASDGIFKVFKGYDPEPDLSIFIDTTNTSFEIADFQANTIFLGNTSVVASINLSTYTGTANNSTNFGGLSLATVQGQITGNAATAYTNAVSYTDTKIGTANTAMVANAAAAYTNAIAIAANATNLASGTVAFARLPALYLGTTQIQSTSAAQAVNGITTFGAGNTTITGFANVISTGGAQAAAALRSGTYGEFLVPQASQGAYNNLVANNDNLLYFSNGTINGGNLVIGTWTDRAAGFGIKFTGSTYDLAVVANTVSLTANLQMSNNHVTSPTLKAYKEFVSNVSITTTTQNLDLSTTNIFNLSMANNVTLSFSNPPAGGVAYTFTLYCKQDATGSRTITWPASVYWPNASPPTMSTGANKIDVFSFFTLDGGTTYLGALSLANTG